MPPLPPILHELLSRKSDNFEFTCNVTFSVTSIIESELHCGVLLSHPAGLELGVMKRRLVASLL